MSVFSGLSSGYEDAELNGTLHWAAVGPLLLTSARKSIVYWVCTQQMLVNDVNSEENMLCKTLVKNSCFKTVHYMTVIRLWNKCWLTDDGQMKKTFKIIAFVTFHAYAIRQHISTLNKAPAKTGQPRHCVHQYIVKMPTTGPHWLSLNRPSREMTSENWSLAPKWIHAHAQLCTGQMRLMWAIGPFV